MAGYMSLLADSSLGTGSMQRHLTKLVKGAADATNAIK